MRSGSKAIVNGRILTPAGEIENGVILTEGSVIMDLGSMDAMEIPGDALQINAEGGYITPGFIDIHVHGGMGADVTEGTPEVFRTMGAFFAAHGVTSYVASILTLQDEKIFRIMDCAREIIHREDLTGATLLGIHLEGPYLNSEQRGAHPKPLLRDPEPGHYMPLLAYDDIIKMVTLAPELKGSRELIEELHNRGIVAAAGHTAAIDREILPLVDAGLRHSTHMYCNMSHFRRDQLMRVGGAVESILFDDRISTEIIGDGHHLNPLLMKLVVKVKGTGNVCFVTDAMPAAGMPDGNYFIGGVEAEVRNGAARLPDHSAYAGSVTTMDICIRNGIHQMGLLPREAVRMATTTPAGIIGVSDKKGSIEKGKDADLVILDQEFRVQKTIVNGNIVYTRTEK